MSAITIEDLRRYADRETKIYVNTFDDPENPGYNFQLVNSGMGHAILTISEAGELGDVEETEYINLSLEDAKILRDGLQAYIDDQELQ